MRPVLTGMACLSSCSVPTCAVAIVTVIVGLSVFAACDDGKHPCPSSHQSIACFMLEITAAAIKCTDTGQECSTRTSSRISELPPAIPGGQAMAAAQ